MQRIDYKISEKANCPSSRRRKVDASFLKHFNNAPIYVLIVAAVIAGFIRHRIDMGVIIGFIQEDRAKKALDSIREMISVTAAVIRGGRKSQPDTEKLVPGDAGAGDCIQES